MEIRPLIDPTEYRAVERLQGEVWRLSDVDADGDVDVTDMQLEAAAWHVTPVTAVYDQNRDGIVDILDVMLVARSFGAVCQ